MLVIGITGPTGCGKTTLLREIEHRGGYIVDCDALYYALLASEEGAALRQELQAAFPAAFDADGTLRRKALGRLVFGDPSRMAQLNEIVFFHVGNAVRARLVHEQSAGRQRGLGQDRCRSRRSAVRHQRPSAPSGPRAGLKAAERGHSV